jgi:hypothetical protein
MIHSSLTRRDFLKLSGAGLLGLLLGDLFPQPASAGSELGMQGRVILSGTPLRESPSHAAKRLAIFGADQVLNLTAAVPGEDEGLTNRLWYRVGTQGYVHSAWIQPVSTSFNRPADSLPKNGALVEVTVPFTENYRELEDGSVERSLRMYYQTTYWAVAIEDRGGLPWYRLHDDRYGRYYFGLAEHMRIVPPEELAPISAAVPEEEKSLLVDLAAQTVIAFEGETAVMATRASTGAPGTFTPNGSFRTYYKRGARHMTSGDMAGEGEFDLPGVPWVSFITDSGVSFHGTYWHNDFGTPHSHGCINLPSPVAKWIYRWTTPMVPAEARYMYMPGQGTQVQVIHSTPQ